MKILKLCILIHLYRIVGHYSLKIRNVLKILPTFPIKYNKRVLRKQANSEDRENHPYLALLVILFYNRTINSNESPERRTIQRLIKTKWRIIEDRSNGFHAGQINSKRFEYVVRRENNWPNIYGKGQ